MSLDQYITRIAVGLIVLMLLAGVLAYASILSELRSLREDITRTSEELNYVESQLDEIGRRISSLEAGSEGLEEIRFRLDSLAEEIAELKDERAIDRERLEELASELAAISVRLDELGSELESIGAASSDALLSIEELRERVEKLTSELDSLSELILFPVEIVDGTGDTVIISSRPERIVSMAPSVTETLYYVRALDRLVGVDDYSDWPEWIAEARETGDIASIGGFWNPSLEAILALDPDLVIGVASAPPHLNVKRILEAYGIPVLLLPNQNLNDIVWSLIMVGRATGNIVEAYEAAARFEAAVASAAVLAENAGASGVKIAVIVWLEPLFVVGWGNWENDIIKLVGAVNVYGDESDESLMGWPMVSVETLVERKPDVIVIMGGHGQIESPEDFVEWLRSLIGESAEEIPAVRDNRIYIITGLYSDVFARPSPRTALAVYVIGAIVAPEIYGVPESELPGVISPESLDILSLIENLVPADVYEFLGEAAG